MPFGIDSVGSEVVRVVRSLPLLADRLESIAELPTMRAGIDAVAEDTTALAGVEAALARLANEMAKMRRRYPR